MCNHIYFQKKLPLTYFLNILDILLDLYIFLFSNLKKCSNRIKLFCYPYLNLKSISP